MDVFKYFDKNTCNFLGKTGSDKWSWEEYYTNKRILEADGVKVILVDMIDHPVEGAVPISNKLFAPGAYPKGTFFVLYCIFLFYCIQKSVIIPSRF
jgi:hypothetical protein